MHPPSSYGLVVVDPLSRVVHLEKRPAANELLETLCGIYGERAPLVPAWPRWRLCRRCRLSLGRRR